MNLKKVFTGALLALLGAVAGHAQTNLTYSPADLFLSFRASNGTGSPQDYMVNIGQAAQFTSATAPFDVTTIGDIKSDLDSVYGVGWDTRTDLFWSVSGSPGQLSGVGADPVNTLYATKVQATTGTPNDANTRWLRKTDSNQTATATKMRTMGRYFATNFSNGQPFQSTANSAVARFQLTSDANSYASYMPGGTTANAGPAPGISFAIFSPTIEAATPGSTALELYRIVPASGGDVDTPSEFVGTFTLSAAGVLTFTPFTDPSIATVAFAASTFSVSETDATGLITLTRGGNTANSFTVNVTTTNGTAVAGTDYDALSNLQVTFNAGDTQATVPVTLHNIAGFQGDRTFSIKLVGASTGASIKSPSTAVVTIQEGDASVAFSSATATVVENVQGGNYVATLVRGANLTGAFSVDVSTGDPASGTVAVAGTDYTGTSVTVNFAANDTSKTVSIPVINRPLSQGDRSFALTLSNVTAGASIVAPSTQTVTIQDGGIPGTLAFGSAALTFEPVNLAGQPNLLQIPIARTVGTDGTVTIDAAITGGTLVAGTDYNTFTNPTTVSFASGDATKTVGIQLKALTAKRTGTIILTLSNVTGGATLGTQATITVTVLARDVKKPVVTLTAPKAGVLASGVTTFDVTGLAADDRGIDHVEVTINGVLSNVTPGAFSAGKASFSKTAIVADNGTNTVSVVAVDPSGNRSAAVTRVVTYVNNRPALTGVYNGLIVPAAGSRSNNTSGLVNLTVGNSGLFSGKVSIGAATIGVKGIVGNDNVVHFLPKLGTTLALLGPGKPAVDLGQLDLVVAGNKVTGNVKATIGGATLATIDGDRAAFDGKTSLVDADYLNVKGKSGFFTVVFPSETQTPAQALTSYPQGDGIGRITLSAKGIASLKGTLADGTIFSASAPLSANYEFPIYAKLYKNAGSIAGQVTFDKTATNSDLSGASFLWFRPAIVGKYYPAGWPTGVTVGAVGTRYSSVVGTSILPNLQATGTANGNATLAFSDGKLTASPLNFNADVATNNKVTVLPAGSKAFSLSLVPGTGGFAGKFTHSDNTSTAYVGVVLQKGANQAGFGYFLSTVPKGSVSTGESGGVTLSAK